MGATTTGRIALFGINYWPEQTGIAPYTTGLAEHLTQRGWEVVVVTGMPHYPEWRVAGRYRDCWQTREQIRGVEVIRLRHHVPTRQSALRRGMYDVSFFLHGLTPLRLRRPDVVLGIIPSLSGALLAERTARRYRVPFGLIFQDIVGSALSQSGMPGGKRVAGVTRAVEGWCARRASGVAVVSEGFRSYLTQLGVDPRRVVHLRNWSHIPMPSRPRAEVRRELGWQPEETIVLHAGAMGLKQGLENVIDAAKRAAHHPCLRFVLMGDGNQRPMLTARAGDCPTVQIVDPCAAERFPDILAAADILLVNERASLLDMALPSKLTSYLVAGRPIVAAVTPEGWTAREVIRSGAGVVVPAEQPDALVAALADLAADPARCDRIAAAGPDYASRYLTAAASLAQADAFLACLLNGHAVPASILSPEALGD